MLLRSTPVLVRRPALLLLALLLSLVLRPKLVGLVYQSTGASLARLASVLPLAGSLAGVPSHDIFLRSATLPTHQTPQEKMRRSKHMSEAGSETGSQTGGLAAGHDEFDGEAGDMHRFISSAGEVGPRGDGGGDGHHKKHIAESRDFDLFESKVFQENARTKSDRYERKLSALRWALSFLIALVTSLVALVVVYGSNYLQQFKYHFTWVTLNHGNDTVPSGDRSANLFAAYGVYLAISLGLCTVAGIMSAVVEPVSLGSGIPEIVMILNGIKVPRGLRFRTLIAKVVGVIFSVGGGLPVGREGPMIHTAAILGAGLSQGVATSINCGSCQRAKCCRQLAPFRNDLEKRDFITCGVASGVSAAFGAPIGGVLFALEEGASFWFRSLTWRALFCSMSAIFVLTLIQSFLQYQPADWGKMSYSAGMFNFGSFDVTGQNTGFIHAYNVWELPFFVIIGITGGAIGVGFNALNTVITRFRKRHILTTRLRMLEVLTVAFLMASTSFGLTVLFGECQCIPCLNTPDQTVCNSNCTPYVPLDCCCVCGLCLGVARPDRREDRENAVPAGPIAAVPIKALGVHLSCSLPPDER